MLVCLVYVQIIDIHQFAMLLVHAFPFVPATRELLDAVAAEHMDVSPQSASPAPVSLVAALKKLDCYLKAFTADCQLCYVPYQVANAGGNAGLSSSHCLQEILDRL